MHDVIHIPKSQFSIWDFYFDICEQHILPARALTPALKFAPNPCAESKGSQEEEWASNYYITPATGSSNQLEIRCCRENQHPAEGELRTLDWAVGVESLRLVGEKMLEWGPCPREAGTPGPWLSSPGERERNAVIISYLPTPPLGQDMTQGQFLSGV